MNSVKYSIQNQFHFVHGFRHNCFTVNVPGRIRAENEPFFRERVLEGALKFPIGRIAFVIGIVHILIIFRFR